MARILADTNVWLRVVDPAAIQHPTAVQAVARLIADGHTLCLCPQNLIEFWAVATRPITANGLGWSREQTATEIAGLETRFTLLPDTPEVFTQWKAIVQTCPVAGKRAHDARLAAVCFAHRADALLTFNGDDFANVPALRLLDPADVEQQGFSAVPQ